MSNEPHDCPWEGCEKSYASEHGLKIHYGREHGESLSKIEVPCDWCGEPKRIYPSEKENYDNHFCNNECHNKWSAENREGENAGGWKGGKTEVDCDACGETIKKNDHELESSEHYFCDKQCYGKWRSEQGGVKVECSHCGGELERSPSEIEKYENYYCDRECMSTHRKESNEFSTPDYSMSGSNNPNWKGGDIETDCDWCGASIKVGRYNYENKDRHYCDTECMGNWRSENQQGENHHQFEKIEVNCAWCGQQLLRKPCMDERNERHFCDNNCHSEWMSENNNKEDHPQWNRTEVDCAWCGEILKLRKSKIDLDQENYFCGLECMGKHKEENYSGSNHPSWEGGSTRITDRLRRLVGPKNWRIAREEALEEARNKCEMCGSEFRPSVHHIIPIAFGGVHAEELLIVVCPSCHNSAEKYIKNELSDFVTPIQEMVDV